MYGVFEKYVQILNFPLDSCNYYYILILNENYGKFINLNLALIPK